MKKKEGYNISKSLCAHQNMLGKHQQNLFCKTMDLKAFKMYVIEVDAT